MPKPRPNVDHCEDKQIYKTSENWKKRVSLFDRKKMSEVERAENLKARKKN